MTIALRGLLGRLLILTAVAAAFACLPAAAQAAAVSRDGNTLRITEDGPTLSDQRTEQNRIEVTAVAGALALNLRITDRVPLTPLPPCSPVNASSTVVDCPAESITTIDVDLGDDKDFLFLYHDSLPDTITTSDVDGGPGVDEVHGLLKGNDTIRGGDEGDNLLGYGNNSTGRDTLIGNTGSDTLDGGAGDDTLRGGASGDEFFGGPGLNDLVDYSTDGTSGVDARPDNNGTSGAGCVDLDATTPGTCEGDAIHDDVEDIQGTGGIDVLRGNSADNELTGLGGDDRLFGASGNDALHGNAGNDRLRGDFGNDNLQGDENTDTVDYTERQDPDLNTSDVHVDLDAGTATAPGAPGSPQESDTLGEIENAETGAGDDTLIGTDGSTRNFLSAGGGSDLLRGKDGGDDLLGGSGFDTVSYVDDSPTDDVGATVTIGDGLANDGSPDDSSSDNVQNDVEKVVGGEDDDTLTGSSLDNTLDGAGGNDTLEGLGGKDILTGGEGNGDVATYAKHTVPVVLTLDGVANDGAAGEGDQIEETVEHLTGSDFADTLVGNASGNRLTGRNGNDVLRGGLGSDDFVGGGGEDTVDYSADGRTSGVTVTLGNNAADDGDPLTPAMTGEDDNVRDDVENVVGTQAGDTISGNSSPNKLFGLGGSDQLNGQSGADVLDGGSNIVAGNNTPGTDVLNGGPQDDTLHGGSNNTGSDGADNINGGTERDTVTYASVAEPIPGAASKERATTVLVSLDNVANDGAPGENDNLTLIEDVVGGAGNDTLVGSVGSAGAQPNRLEGRAGDDTLKPGTEPSPPATPYADVVIGGAGSDRADYSDRGTDDLVITLDGPANNDGVTDETDHLQEIENVTTAAGDDHVTGSSASSNDIVTDGGTDTVVVKDSNGDTVDCGSNPAGAGDNADADNLDVLENCENVTRPPQPLISVKGPQDAVAEGGVATFVISRDAPTAEPAEVAYSTSNGTAVAGPGQDYEAKSGTATIPANQTSVEVTVQTLQDNVHEDPETFNLNISHANAAPGGTTASATIDDDEPTPTVTVGDATLAEEGDSGDTTTLNLPITLSGPSSKPVTVTYSTGGGTATAGADYESVSGGTVVIPAGDTTANAPVEVLGDDTDEPDETFVVTISSPVNAALADDKTGTATIADDDGAPTVSIDDTATTEADTGTSTLSFTVSLSRASEKTVTVDYATSDGSAGADDYESRSDTVTFAPGTTSATVEVPVKSDDLPEEDETLTVTLSNPTEAQLGDATATGTINDDDMPTLSVDDVTVDPEGNTGSRQATFKIKLSEPSGREITVGYATAAGTASSPDDYADAQGTVTFAKGETEKTVDVTVNGDVLDEDDETFSLVLSGASGAAIADGSGTATITDDDPSPALTIADDSVTEGNAGSTDLTFTVTQSAVSGRDVTVKYATSNGTATAGSDYTATNGTLTIPAGQISGEIKVPVTGDAVDEPDETLTLTLTEPDGATLGEDAAATGTITDDEGTPSITVADATVAEGDAGTSTDLTFAVTLSGTSSGDVTVKYATSDGTATAGSDYTATSGTLTIPAGQTSGEIKVPVTGDGADEPDEALTLTLSEPAGATVADDSATGTITDDDQPAVVVPVLSVDDIRVAEGDTGTTPAVFTVTLSAPATGTVTTKFVTSDGTATSGSDYALTAGTLTFAAGERTKTVRVDVIGDRRNEDNEAFALALVDPQGATLGKGTGAALITDDETPRVAPRRVIARTTPSVDRSLPYRFRTSGRLTLPSGVRRSDACAGKVQVRFKAGRKTISTRRVNLRRDCTFSRRVSFGIRSRLRPGRLKVEVRFLGNAVLLPKSAPRRFVRVR